MTLRIVAQTTEDEAVIVLHGWLTAAEVSEVVRVAGKGACLRIDLAQLAGADAAGLRALTQLREGGARLTGASRYIELLMERSAADVGEP